MMEHKPVRILQIGMTCNIGGMETYLMNQYRHLDRNKIRYDFVNMTADWPMVFTEEIETNGDTVYQICRRSKNPLLHYLEWCRFFKKYGKFYDAIILNTCNLHHIFPLVIAKLVGIPIRIIHSHNSGEEEAMGCIRKLQVFLNERLMRYSVNTYWACSEVAGKWMFGNHPFTVIHNAIDVQKFEYNPAVRKQKRDELGVQGKFVIGHVGRFSYQKNHEFIIKVFAEVAKQKNNAVLMLIGDASAGGEAYLQTTKQEVHKLRLEEKVLFLGMRTDVNELMQAMDCFLFPSHFEGLGIVALEAQTSGIPCYFSTAVPKDVDITPLVHFISLQESPSTWAKEIVASSNVKRKNMNQYIQNAGYDITTEIRKIEDFYK